MAAGGPRKSATFLALGALSSATFLQGPGSKDPCRAAISGGESGRKHVVPKVSGLLNPGKRIHQKSALS